MSYANQMKKLQKLREIEHKKLSLMYWVHFGELPMAHATCGVCADWEECEKAGYLATPVLCMAEKARDAIVEIGGDGACTILEM